MTSDVPALFWLYAIGAGVVLGFLAVVSGVVLVVRQGLALKKKAEKFKTLPFAGVLELTQARVDIASRSIDRAPLLMARAQRAMSDIAAARTSVTSSAFEARDFLKAMLSRS